jgi:hypothetical protein
MRKFVNIVCTHYIFISMIALSEVLFQVMQCMRGSESMFKKKIKLAK